MNPPANILPVITIQLNPNGSVTVNGPLQDRVLCYGMIETAKDIIQRLNDEASKRSAIKVATEVPAIPGENGGRMN